MDDELTNHKKSKLHKMHIALEFNITESDLELVHKITLVDHGIKGCMCILPMAKDDVTAHEVTIRALMAAVADLCRLRILGGGHPPDVIKHMMMTMQTELNQMMVDSGLGGKMVSGKDALDTIVKGNKDAQNN